MKLILNNHTSNYQVQSLIQMFYPLCSYNLVYSNFEKTKEFKNQFNKKEDIVICSLIKKKNYDYIIFLAQLDEKKYIRHNKLNKNELSQALNINAVLNSYFVSLGYEILSRHKNRTLPWGFYTGIRPVKTINDYNKILKNNGEIALKFEENYAVSNEKTALAIQTAEFQKEILLKNNEKFYSLFIFIPFCPSRCKYCSFVSNAITNDEAVVWQYIKNLIKELEYTANLLEKTDKILNTIYIGGGTPSSINPQLLENLLKTVKDLFLKDKLIEYTFEAGRADTITEEKLLIMKKYGVNRISINPQTFNDEILKKIGRKHTSQEVEKAVYLARKCGFNNINMDFIAGLEDEDFDSFKQSIVKGCRLNPENITVHTLTVKRAASLKEQSNSDEILQKEDNVRRMLHFSQEYLYKMGYHPYYLYRQKNTVGSLENVGFSKIGYDCVYNVVIMEEAQTIIACGAGASTKLILNHFDNKNHIKRIYNYKYPFEYNSNFDEILKRKDEMFTFLKNDI